MSEFKALYMQDQEVLNKLDEDIKSTYKELRDKSYTKLSEDIKAVERYLHIFDNDEKYYNHISCLVGNLEVFLQTKTNVASSKANVSVSDDLRDNFYDYLKEHTQAYDVNKIDEHKSKGTFDFMITDYINNKDKYGKILQKYMETFNAMNLIDGDYCVLDGVIYEILSKKQEVDYQRYIKAKYNELFKDFNKLKSDVTKTIDKINANKMQYVNYWNRQASRILNIQQLANREYNTNDLYKQSRVTDSDEVDLESLTPMSDILNNKEVIDYIDSLEPLTLDDDAEIHTVEQLQEHIDNNIKDFFMVGDKAVVKLKVLGYTDTDCFDDDEHSAVGYTSDYVEIEVSLSEDYDLAKSLGLPTMSIMKGYNTLYIPYRDDIDFNKYCIEAVASWLDIYELNRTIYNLNNLFSVFHKYGWFNYDVYFKLDMDKDIQLLHLIKSPRDFDITEIDLTEALKAEDNIDKCTNEIIKAVVAYTIKYINDDIVSFDSLAYSSTIHQKSEIPLEFYTDTDMNEDMENDNDNGIIISLSLSEALVAKRNYSTLKKLIDIANETDALIKHLADKGMKNINEKKIRSKMAPKDMFGDYFAKGDNVSLAVLSSNVITRTLGITSKTSITELSKAMCSNRDFCKCMPKKLTKNEIYTSSYKSLLKQLKIKEGQYGVYYSCIELVDKNGKMLNIIEELSKQEDKNLDLYYLAQDLKDRCEMNYKNDSNIKLHLYINVSDNKELSLARFPFLEGTAVDYENSLNQNYKADIDEINENIGGLGKDNLDPLDEVNVETIIRFMAMCNTEKM